MVDLLSGHQIAICTYGEMTFCLLLSVVTDFLKTLPHFLGELIEIPTTFSSGAEAAII